MKKITFPLPVIAAACAMAFAVAAATPARAQHAHGQHGQHGQQGQQGQSGSHSHYAGMQQRAIKALSDQQVADLREGKGMSMALPAELNGYPGPLHTLQLADQLKLTPDQTSRTQALFAQMQQEAKAAGESVIAAETALDSLFKDKRVQPDTLTAAVARAAQAQGALRETHLRYHLRMMDVLSAAQVTAYNRLRGY
ncbi:periplasmic heavy metal sensor [Acidovorax sp. BL-A-41-H1]|uniref:periplasmic heavy metal sensor n=1 Tax=Acidovorax sp. BL-A-41-H1 TaxID=3421102 RepID=UPI003F796396